MPTLTPKQAAGLTARFVLYQLGLFVLVGGAQGLVAGLRDQHAPATKGIEPVAVMVVNTLAAFLVLRGQLRKNNLPWVDFFRPRAKWVRLLPVFLLIMIGEIVLISEASNGMQAVLPPPAWLREQFSPMNDLVGHPFSAPFTLIVIAAVTEEFLFRGLILRGLLHRLDPVRAVVLSALLFALMHLNPWQMPGAFFIGLVFGWVYLRTRSLTLCIAGHGLHNAMSLLANGLPFTVAGFNQAHASNVVLFQPWWFNLIGIAALAFGAYLFNRMAPVLAWIPPVQKIEPPPLPVSASVADGLAGKI